MAETKNKTSEAEEKVTIELPTKKAFMEQVKSVCKKSINLFKNPEVAVKEENNDIMTFVITLAVASLVLFVTALIGYEKLISMVFGIFTDGLGLSITFEMAIKMLFISILACAVYFGVYALVIFAVAKMYQKKANFKNILINANELSFVIVGNLIITVLLTMINVYIAIAFLIMGILYFTLLTNEYMKVKFNLAKAKLFIMTPLIVTITTVAGGFLLNKLVEWIML